MPKSWGKDSARQAKAAMIDTTVPNAARVGDYLHGGRNNFEADRRAAWRLTAAAPVVSTIGPAAHAFHLRVVRYLVAEAGIRQFLDIGTRLVMADSTHEVAQSLAPESRVVYADSDPMVLSHTRSLVTSTVDGDVSFIDADLRNPWAIVADAADHLDFRRRVAVLLPSTLGFVAGADEAAGVVWLLMKAVPSGSYLAVYHLASDVDPALPAAARRWNAMSAQPTTLRSRAEIAAVLDSCALELVPPGLVLITDWHPAAADPRFELPVPVYAAVGRKP